MNRTQRWLLAGGLLLIFSATTIPPAMWIHPQPGDNWHIPYGRVFLLAPTGYKEMGLGPGSDWFGGFVRIDYYRLGLEWLTIASVVGAAFLIAGLRKRVH